MKAASAKLLSLVFLQITFAGDWSQWRGEQRDGFAQDEKPLNALAAKPKQMWQVPAGKGQGGLILSQGRLVMCHETVVGGKPMETAAVIDTTTGKTLWQTPYSESWQYTNVYGPGPRTAPMIDGDLLFCQSATGVVASIAMKSCKLI